MEEMTYVREHLDILATIKVPGNTNTDMDADDDGEDDFDAFDDLVSVVSLASSAGSMTKSLTRDINDKDNDVYNDDILVYNDHDISSSFLSPSASTALSLQGFSKINVWARETFLLSSSLTSLKYPGPGIPMLGLFLPADDAGVALPIITSSGNIYSLIMFTLFLILILFSSLATIM